MSGFEGFQDSSDAPFYRSGAMTPQATWAEANDRLVRLLDSVREGMSAPITVERICRWHRSIFVTTFARDAGRIRADHEPVWFSVPVDLPGGAGRRVVQGAEGQHEIRRQLAAACSAFEQLADRVRTDTASTSVSEAVTPSVALYVAILRIHPFVDGNLRAAFVALQVALQAVGIPAVSFGRHRARHDEALGHAMPGGRAENLGPLVELVLDILRPQ
jgi:fido (protein-threonine AMPylation protein)